jgi:hypothetical protein
MTGLSPGPGPKKPQSPLSEAVEQAARVGSMWWDDLTDFAKDQADRLASGNYGLTDLTTAQLRLMRICVHNGVNAASTWTDNIALLSYTGPAAGGPATRTVQVPVSVPAQVNVVFQVSDLVADQHRIPRAKLRLDPPAAFEAIPKDVPVTVVVDCSGAPAGTYGGTIFTSDGSVTVDFRIAIDELGEPPH